MKIAFIGTRGVPARYGGFETAAEEIGARLVERGHQVVVYCRGTDTRTRTYRGMRRVRLPAVPLRTAETLSHTALSLVHHASDPCDVAIVFNAANAPLLPLLRARGVPAAVHVDGLEWQRAKWGRRGRQYYRMAERSAVRRADALIADARGIQDYYETQHRAATWFIPYGAPDTAGIGADRLSELGLDPGGYHLVVARMEPENKVDVVVRGYRASGARLPLVVVGGAAYNQGYWDHVVDTAHGDDRIRLVGPVWDQQTLDQLYAHSFTYLHGHSVGGTNPSLLRAGGAGAAVLAYDVPFSREVLLDEGRYFHDEAGVAQLLDDAEADPTGTAARGRRTHDEVVSRYTWDAVARNYERLCEALRRGTAASPPPDLYNGAHGIARTRRVRDDDVDLRPPRLDAGRRVHGSEG